MTRGRPAGSRDVADHADRLVDGEVDELRPRQRFAVDANFLLQRIDARAKLRHDLAIDFDAAFANQFFAFAPAGDAGLGENFLQPLAAVGRRTVVARRSVVVLAAAKRARAPGRRS